MPRVFQGTFQQEGPFDDHSLSHFESFPNLDKFPRRWPCHDLSAFVFRLGFLYKHKRLVSYRDDGFSWHNQRQRFRRWFP